MWWVAMWPHGTLHPWVALLSPNPPCLLGKEHFLGLGATTCASHRPGSAGHCPRLHCHRHIQPVGTKVEAGEISAKRESIFCNSPGLTPGCGCRSQGWPAQGQRSEAGGMERGVTLVLGSFREEDQESGLPQR